ncbi:MAG: hypothetical protein ACRDY3_07035 [Acidimicrobiales bacterium]
MVDHERDRRAAAQGSAERRRAARVSARRIADQVTAELVRRDAGGGRLAALLERGHFDPGAAADVLLPAADAWEEEIGPFLDVDGVRRLLARPGGDAVSKQAVSKRRDLLALRTGSGRVVYPRFQFRHGTVLAGLGRALSALPEGRASRWTVASWLMTPCPELGGDRPDDLLAEGAVDPVLSQAEDWAAGLSA